MLIGELGVDERDDVRAGHGPVVTEVDDAADLGQGESGGLGYGDEAQPGEHGLVVDAVAVSAPFGIGQEPLALIEPDRLPGHPGSVGKLTDQHLVRPPPLTLHHGTRSSVADMEISLLYIDGCPNWKVADQRLASIASERPDVVVTRHRVATMEEAERLGVHGSPSIVVDGVDVFAEPGAGVGLSCRVYRTPEGLAGAPTTEQLRAALGVKDEGAR